MMWALTKREGLDTDNGRANMETPIPGMSDPGVRPGQEVQSTIFNSCRGLGPNSRPTHTRDSHFQNYSRLSHTVCKFTGPSTFPNTVRKLFPN